MAIATCALCNSGAIINRQESASRTIYNCPHCGVFIMSDLVVKEAAKKSDELAAYLMSRKLARESDTVLISFEKANLDKDYLQMTVDKIAGFFPKTFSGQMDMALKNLGRMSEFPGHEIKIVDIETAPLFYVKGKKPEALVYIMKAMHHAGFIEIRGLKGDSLPFGVIISPKGWERLENPTSDAIRHRNMFAYSPGSANSIIDQFYSTIGKIAEECGYRSSDNSAGTRMGEKVTFELVAAIKSSEVTVCDFTANAGSAYYTAALAQQLGNICILTCHESKRKTLQFDDSQYRVISWNNPEELYLDLSATIRALEQIGKV